jgi:hypothetical protein
LPWECRSCLGACEFLDTAVEKDKSDKKISQSKNENEERSARLLRGAPVANRCHRRSGLSMGEVVRAESEEQQQVGGLMRWQGPSLDQRNSN